MSDNAAVTYVFANGPGNTADANQINTNFADLVGYLTGRFGGASSAQTWIADSTGRATPRTLSGDATVSNTGALTIGSGKVGTSKLADGAATPDKLGLTATETTQPSSAVNLLSSWTDCISVTPSAGTYLMWAQLVAISSVAANGALMKFSTDSVARSIETWTGTIPSVTLNGFTVVTLDGSTAFKVQGQKQVGGGSATDIQSPGGGSPNGLTKLLRIRIA